MKADPPATRREQQRLETRRRIVEAAMSAFAERGFHGASTREIASRCGVTQGLVTYHFGNKDTLWRAAADHLFASVLEDIRTRVATMSPGDPRSLARAVVKAYVLCVAERPELMRLLTREGAVDNPRAQWLVETHLSKMYQGLAGVLTIAGVADEVPVGHLYYVMAGAGSLIFSVPATCRQLTGLDPTDPEVIERHADFVARLLVPEADGQGPRQT